MYEFKNKKNKKKKKQREKRENYLTISKEILRMKDDISLNYYPIWPF